MNEEELLIVIRALKLEILELLQNSDMRTDAEAQTVLKTIDNTFQRIGVEVDTVLPSAVLKSYMEGLDYANDDMYFYNMAEERLEMNLGAGLATAQNSQVIQATLATQVHYQAIAEINDDLMMDLKAALRTARDSTEISIVNALVDVQRDLQSGIIRGNNRKHIQQRVMKSFVDNGFQGFVTKDGAKIQLEHYAETVTRTNLKRANTRASVNRYKQSDVTLFKVGGNTPTCSECHRYQDIVFSMDPDNEDFPYLDPNNIPFHPNCQCSIRPFVIEYKSKDEITREKKNASKFSPEKDTRPESQKKAYADKQRINQRNNYEKKRYAEVKTIMGDEAPKTLGGFRRMKRSNSENYQNLMYDYQESRQQLKEQGVKL